MRFGAHVSVAGGIQHAPARARALGCEVYQIFTRPPRGGPAPGLSPEILEAFRSENARLGLDEWVVHAPYIVNFASPVERIAHATVALVRVDLERASALGARSLMVHLGSALGRPREEALARTVRGLLAMLDGYRGTTRFCIEIAAGAGNVIGASFEEVGAIIRSTESARRSLRGTLGVCFDTCHAFASGYDLRNPAAVDATLDAFDRHVGLGRLAVIHGNDSKVGLGERRDRHAHIGKGKIGREGFRAIVNHPRLKGLALILELPPAEVRPDLRLLARLREGSVGKAAVRKAAGPARRPARARPGSSAG